MGRPALSCSERTAAKPGCHCEHCRAYWRERNYTRSYRPDVTNRGAPRKHRGQGARADVIALCRMEQARKQKRDWARKNQEQRTQYMREYRAGNLRREQPPAPLYRCETCGLNDSVPCRCGVTPTWAKEVA